MDKLIKRLWECASEECFNCSQYTPTTNASVCSNELMKQAADAIEELNKDFERSKEWEKFWEKEANEALKNFQTTVAKIPHWVPVTERLPDVFKHVLVNIPGMAPHPTVQEAFREKNGMWYSNGFRYGADEITHWMPLPEPPPAEEGE